MAAAACRIEGFSFPSRAAMMEDDRYFKMGSRETAEQEIPGWTQTVEFMVCVYLSSYISKVISHGLF